MKYILTTIYLIFTTGGITLMKLGGDSLKLSFKGGFNLKMGWITFLGFACYLISFLLWQRLLIKYDLSILVPIVTGISQIIIMTIGYLIFKETFNVQSLIGAIIVIVGIIIMTIANK